MKVKVNKKVPNFNVSVTGKDQLNSKDLLGKKVVIYFYPKDNTPGCTCLLYTSPSPRDS